MKIPFTVVIGLVLFAYAPARFAAQTMSSPEVPLRWIPFTATQHESNSWVRGVQAIGSQFYDQEFTGVFARDESGADYERWTHSGSPQTRFADVAYLIDRVQRAEWQIDYDYKNFHRKNLELAGHPELSAAPMSMNVFLHMHSKDLFVGHKSLNGLDCLVYRIHSSTGPKRFWREVWFAPSLNFFPVRERYLSPEGSTITLVMEKIRVGPPDPDLFHLPKGFTLLH